MKPWEQRNAERRAAPKQELTEEQKREIKERAAHGVESIFALSRRYNVSAATIYQTIHEQDRN